MQSKCICQGNWRAIVKDCTPLFDREYIDMHGDVYTFFGVVHASDDYYYGMSCQGKVQLLSCVCSIEAYGFTLLELPALPEGVWELKGGKFGATCVGCGRDDEIPCDISEIPMEGYRHYCGGSPRCCP